MTHTLSAEQSAMEKRYHVPYNWCKGAHSRQVRQKTGLWKIAAALAGDIRGKKVLDAGCGDGWYSAKMVSADAQVSGADYSERAVRFAQAIVEDASFTAASLTKLPYPDASFDVVFSFQVLEHIPPADLPQAVKEIARVTKPGGTIVISVPSTVRTLSKAHYQHFTPASITEQLAPAIAVERIVGQHHRTWAFSLIERLIENRFYTLERLGTWFNRSWYLRQFNETSATHGDNLVVLAHPAV